MAQTKPASEVTALAVTKEKGGTRAPPKVTRREELSHVTTDRRYPRAARTASQEHCQSANFITATHSVRQRRIKLLDGTPVNHSDYVAIFEEADVVWSCFHGGVVEEISRTNWLDDEMPPKPRCPIPKAEWEDNEKTGKPNNPLGVAFELPLITNDGEAKLLVFKASTKLGARRNNPTDV